MVGDEIRRLPKLRGLHVQGEAGRASDRWQTPGAAPTLRRTPHTLNPYRRSTAAMACPLRGLGATPFAAGRGRHTPVRMSNTLVSLSHF